MANGQVSITKIVDGDKVAVLQVYIRGDGSGDFSEEVVADPAELSPPKAHKPCFSLREIAYAVSGFDVRLSYDSVPDLPIWLTPSASASGYDDFRSFGGIIDRGGLDGTGKLLIATSGLAADMHGSFLITLKKRGQ